MIASDTPHMSCLVCDSYLLCMRIINCYPLLSTVEDIFNRLTQFRASTPNTTYIIIIHHSVSQPFTS